MMDAIEKKGEYLTRVIMAEFGISEDEMTLGPGEHSGTLRCLLNVENLLQAFRRYTG
jgi:hypothetical protein